MPNVLLSERLYNPQIIEPLRTFSWSQYGDRLFSILVLLGFVICVVAFIILLIAGGIQWITSGGGKQSLESARNKITNAITGLIILFLLWLILQIVNLIFGINIGELGIPDFEGRPPAIPISTNTPTPTHTLTPTPRPNGASCTASSQCASGFCASTADSDGDTFHPAYVSGTGICVSALDCNDSNANVYPGQTRYFETGVNGSTTNFDYDCNGINNKWTRLDCLSSNESLSCSSTPRSTGNSGWLNSVPNCGDNIVLGPLWKDCGACTILWNFYQCYNCQYQIDCNSSDFCLNESDTAGWNVGSFDLYPDIAGYTRMPCK